MTTATLPAQHTAPGFRVTKTDDATIFHNVPIFAECSRGELTFDANWIREAVAEAKAGERDGHLPPLHTRHHEPGTEAVDGVRSVGVFKILGAGPLTFKGTRITAIYADLIVTDTYFAEELGRMRYPYRSVEIFLPDGPPKINGLALLDHEAPYLELPMLMAGVIDDQTTGEDGVASATFSMDFTSREDDPVLGSVRHGAKAFLLFKLGDETMEPTTNTDELTEEQKAAAATAKAAAETAAKFADDKDSDHDKEDMEGDDTMDVSAIVKAIEGGTIAVADMDAIIAAIQSQKGGGAGEEAEPEAAPAPAPGAEIMSAKNSQAINFARVSGENAALKARLDARDAADKRRDDVAGAMTLLAGKPLGSDLEGKLNAFHKEAGGNAVLFKAFVDSMDKAVGVMPTDDTGANFAGQHGKTPALAMKYQTVSGTAVDRAAHFCREYDTAFKGRGMRASQASYVATQLKREGIELPEAAAV